MDSSTATGKQSALGLSPLEDKSGGIFDQWNVPWKHNKRHNINIRSANIPLTEASSFHNQSRELSNSLGKPTLLLIILIFYFYLKIFAQPKLDGVRQSYWVHLSGAAEMHWTNTSQHWRPDRDTRQNGGQTPRGDNANQAFPFLHRRVNKRWLPSRPFIGKNSLTRLKRNAVICKAFPAKRFISCPWGKCQFLLSLTQSLMLALSSTSPVLSSSPTQTPMEVSHDGA